MVMLVCTASGSWPATGWAREAWTAPEDAASLVNPFPNGPSTIAAGKRLYENRCADCHGKKGNGKGSAAADLDPKPVSFYDPNVGQQTDGALFWKITVGRRPMPAYRNKLSEEERWQVVSYLRTLTANPAQKKQKNKT